MKPHEVDPNNITKIEDLTQKDLVRLLRIINSFRRKDIVDKFITDIGELSANPKYFAWQISMWGCPTVGEYFINEKYECERK